jgi:aminoglycoside phosphotransferase (APT) family kinase protein
MPHFTSKHAYTILERACRETGEAFPGAELLRIGENAIFRLAGTSSAIVVRVGRDAGRLPIAERELCFSRWLGGSGAVPVARVHEEIPDQPRMVEGHPVTFWRYVEPHPERPTVVDLAGILRALHAFRASPCDLPPFDPLLNVRARLRRGLGLTADDRNFLRDRCDAVGAALPELEFVLPAGPIHGDAHTGNLLGGRGAAVLTDFEVCATGPREWDLVPVAVGRARLGISSQQWRVFVAAYGFDVCAWPGYPVLREARELGMTTWLAQNAAESGAIAREVALRIRCLRDGDHGRTWTAF